MTRSRYSINEALNRLLRVMEGKAISSDAPGVIPGEVLSSDEALSDLAELWEGSLPNETLNLPSAGLPIATPAEILGGTANDVVMTPYGVNSLKVWGGIYTWTGTATLEGYSSSAFAKITGSFQNSMGGYGLLPQPTADNILLGTIYGTFLFDFNISFRGSSAINYAIEPYVGSLGIPQAVGRITPMASGSITQVNGHGYQYVSGSTTFDLRLQPSAEAWMVIESISFTVERAGT